MRPKSNNEEKKKINKGNLNGGITTLLLNDLLLSNDIFLVKQNIILRALKSFRKTQIKLLDEEPSLPNSLVKALLMLLHILLLVHYQLLFKLLVGLRLLSHCSLDSDSFSWASKSSITLASSSISTAMPSTLATKSFFIFLQALAAHKMFITVQPCAHQFDQDNSNLKGQLVVWPHSINKGNGGISYLGALLPSNRVSHSPPLGDLCLQGRYLVQSFLLPLSILFQNRQTSLEEDFGRITSVLHPN